MPIQIHYEKQSTHCSGHQFCRSSTELSLVSNLKIGCQNISADVDFLRLKFNRSFFIKVPLLLRENFHCSFVFFQSTLITATILRGGWFSFLCQLTMGLRIIECGPSGHSPSSSPLPQYGQYFFWSVQFRREGMIFFLPPHTPNMYFLMENLRARQSPPLAHLRCPNILLRKNGLLPCQAQFRHY